MGELRLYAVGIDEVRAIRRAPAVLAEQLRPIADRAFAPTPAPQPTGLLGKIGPLFRRAPDTPVRSPTDPEPADLEVLLTGAHVRPERTGATWRLLEGLVQGLAWADHRLDLGPDEIDRLDFDLSRGGCVSAVGLRHLLNHPTELELTPVAGLILGWHPYATVAAMRDTYRLAADQLTGRERELVEQLTTWLDGFGPWAEIAPTLGRPIPDLIGFATT